MARYFSNDGFEKTETARFFSNYKIESIENIQDLINIVSDHIATNNRILWFRGHFDANWPLIPSIWRDYNNEDERNFVHRFRSRAHMRNNNLPGYYEHAKWLSLMQHYELPTRLLDWTRSPLIALYFSLERYVYEKKVKPIEACIWMLEPHKLNKIENLGEYTPSIESEKCSPLIDPAFNSESAENGQVFSVMASEFDMRMFVQQGCFTIHGRKTPLSESVKCREYLTKIIIPKDVVFKLAHEIDYCGFRKGDLFPDLINLSKELKGIYKPRNKTSC